MGSNFFGVWSLEDGSVEPKARPIRRHLGWGWLSRSASWTDPTLDGGWSSGVEDSCEESGGR